MMPAAAAVASIIAIILGLVTALIFPIITQLMKVGTGFTAKTVCSGYFVSRRPVIDLFEYELAGLSAALFGIEVDNHHQSVLSFVGPWPEISKFLMLPSSRAYFISETLGCRLGHGPSAAIEAIAMSAKSPATANLNVSIDEVIQEFLEYEVSPAALTQNHSRAMVVLHRGVLVGEVYQSLSHIGPDTKLLGWSMTKSIQAAMYAAGVQAGLFKTYDAAEFIKSSESTRIKLMERNEGKKPLLIELLGMTDILEQPEDYSLDGAIPKMLFSSEDYAADALHSNDQANIKSKRIKRIESPPPGWYYSSGLSNVLAAELRSKFQSDIDYYQFPFKQIFDKISASSFVLELDPSGTFAASSFSYATARDWARLGQLFLQDGAWDGEQLLSKEVLQLIRRPTKGSGGHYGGSIWLNPAQFDVSVYNELPLNHYDKNRHVWLTTHMPADTYFMSGFEGQFVIIIPSMQLVIVRLGFTPDTGDDIPDDGKQRIQKFSKKELFGTIVDLVKRREKLI